MRSRTHKASASVDVIAVYAVKARHRSALADIELDRRRLRNAQSTEISTRACARECRSKLMSMVRPQRHIFAATSGVAIARCIPMRPARRGRAPESAIGVSLQ